MWGVSSEATKKRLLGEKDLTCAKVTELALSLEAAHCDAAKMISTPEAVNFVSNKKIPGNRQVSEARSESGNCFCCGKPNHRASECRYKGYKCHNCGRTGHLKSICKLKNTRNQSAENDKKESDRKRQKSQHYVNEIEELTGKFGKEYR